MRNQISISWAKFRNSYSLVVVNCGYSILNHSLVLAQLVCGHDLLNQGNKLVNCYGNKFLICSHNIQYSLFLYAKNRWVFFLLIFGWNLNTLWCFCLCDRHVVGFPFFPPIGCYRSLFPAFYQCLPALFLSWTPFLNPRESLVTRSGMQKNKQQYILRW